MIPPKQVQEILDAMRIEEVVGEFVSLRRRGANLIGLCPFHGEKTPSFAVNPVRNIFKCFGCGKGGSSVTFLMEHERLTYPEALRWLAKKYNIEIQEIERTPEQMAERLLTRELAELTMEDSDQELSIPAPGSAEALAAVRRLTTLFADASIPDLEQALADPMIALANVDMADLPE